MRWEWWQVLHEYAFRQLAKNISYVHPRNISFLLIVFLFSLHTDASWAPIEESTLFVQSDLIIQAEITEIGVDPRLPENLLAALVKIEAKFKGEDKQIYILTPAITAARVSDQIVLQEGQSGFWFLTKSNLYPGFYLLNHPQRFWPLSQSDKFLQLKELHLSGKQ